jgi:16S rRNA (cytosine1402-N4)-methyltransferase
MGRGRGRADRKRAGPKGSDRRPDASERSMPHAPVLLAEMLSSLAPADGETIVDATFGAGGYSRAILQAADCRVLAIDRDPTAIPRMLALAGETGGRLLVGRGRFSEMIALAAVHGLGLARVDGIVLDIGVSSMQLDRAERGFSFMADGPLDMRMGGDGPSAADVVATWSEGDLADAIFLLGEEPASRRIARAIVAARGEVPIERTGELAEIVARATGGRGPPGRHPATRTFQALRILVNDELGELAAALAAAEQLLAPGGRLVVVSFHSLEDRIVKQFLTERSGRRPTGSRHLPPTNVPERAASFRILNTRPVTPGEDETAANPRARSARLRAAVRTGVPAPAPDEQEMPTVPGPRLDRIAER